MKSIVSRTTIGATVGGGRSVWPRIEVEVRPRVTREVFIEPLTTACTSRSRVLYGEVVNYSTSSLVLYTRSGSKMRKSSDLFMENSSEDIARKIMNSTRWNVGKKVIVDDRVFRRIAHIIDATIYRVAEVDDSGAVIALESN